MRSSGGTALALFATPGLALLLALAATAQPLYAFNHRNPRWETIDRGSAHQRRKPYKPLHFPPETLPPRHQRGLLSGMLTAEELALTGCVAIAALTVAAQWLALSVGMPPALLLIVFGGIAGPVTEFLDPDMLFGDLLLPLVSMALAMILFVESLTLRATYPAKPARAARRLASAGLAITLIVGATAAYFLLQLSVPLALLFASVLALTGPTARVHSGSRSSRQELPAVLQDEQMITQLAGTVVIILIFKAVLAGGFRGFGGPSWIAVRNTIGFGLLFGVSGGGVLRLLLQRQCLPQSLDRSLPLVLALTVFALANVIQADSGFFAVIVMGALLSSRRAGAPEYAARWRGRWYDLLAGTVLLVLVARLQIDDFAAIGATGAIFVAVLVLTTRPLAVGLATLGGPVSWRERLLLSVMAPRGVLAAGLGTIVAVRLADARHPEAAVWLPLTLLVVTGTQITSILAPLLFRKSVEPKSGIAGH